MEVTRSWTTREGRPFRHSRSLGLSNAGGWEDRLDLIQEQAKLAKLRQEKLDLEIEETKGNLVLADAVEKHWKDKLLSFRGRMLSLPRKFSPLVRATSTDQEAEQLLVSGVYEALEELSGNGIPKRTRENRHRSQSSGKPATKANRQRVGGPKKKTQHRSKRRGRTVENS